MTIEWSDSLATGVASVDCQHKELIQKAGLLEEALQNPGNSDQEITKLIKFLETYVVQHFKDEEELMLANQYPGYPAQKHAHDTFIENFKELKALFNQEGITPALRAKLKIQVNGWLVGHIQTLDKKLGEFMKTKV